jgi:ketosteroid isomerase-like protein
MATGWYSVDCAQSDSMNDIVVGFVDVAAASSNVKRTLEALEAFNRRDPEAFMRYVGADFEWRPFLLAGIEGGAYRGHEGVREWFANVDEMFEGFSAETSEIRDLGDRVVILGTLRARGRGGGVPVDSPLGVVVGFDKEGVARRGVAFTSHAEALAHAGVTS